jgi:hypothetical protein
LEDEPTLVRAVKAVKRTMARDERVKRGYISLTISSLANLIVFVAWFAGGSRMGVAFAYIGLGVGWILTSQREVLTMAGGGLAVVFGMVFLLPVSGVHVPYHPFLLRLYHPSIQSLLQRVGVFVLLVVMARDIMTIVNLKLEQWRLAKMEEERRQEKMRGIFYTPVKNTNLKKEGSFGITKRDVKSRSFAFS